jgi:hypothetical protein
MELRKDMKLSFQRLRILYKAARRLKRRKSRILLRYTITVTKTRREEKSANDVLRSSFMISMGIGLRIIQRH